MTRECSGCGKMHCSGECFDECDPDAVELWESIKRLSEQYREKELIALRDADSMMGDPMLSRKVA